jgi:hypothetical protein
LAVDDWARTVPGQPVAISVLTNDSAANGGQLAILSVTKPTHGSVLINSNGLAGSPEVSALLQWAALKLSNTVVEVSDTNRYPRATTNGVWLTRSALDWTTGFFPGTLWYLFEQTGDPHFQSWAQAWMGAIAPQQYNTNYHDLGFELNNSFGAGYRLTGNPDFRAVVLQAAQSLSTRYNGAARCISWVGPVTNAPIEVIQDTMMNIELLLHAAALGGNQSYYDMAFNHAVTTMFNHLQPDGGSYHTVTFDGNTGAVLSKSGVLNTNSDDTWARGEAWLTYGFTMAYRETHDARFLNTAQKVADYYLANVPPDFVPYWDYQAPGIPNEPRDSSAAAITLAGLVELSQFGTNFQDNVRFWRAARNLLNSLTSTNYLAQGSVSSGLLLHGTGEPPTDTTLETDVSLIYGDYYFVEALARLAKLYRQTTLTYIPAPGFSGTDTFSYQVGDSGGNCASAVVTVLVAPAPFALQLSLAPLTRLPTISFPTATGHLYQVQYANDLHPPVSWNLVATNLPGSGYIMSVTDSNPAAPRFYRVGLGLP